MEDEVDEITLIKNMNIYKKIQKVKKELSERELKKSGENSFSKFKYYELGDFMPSIIELCDKYGLFTKITFEDDIGSKTYEENGKYITEDTLRKEKAKLLILNVNNPDEIEEYSCDVKDLDLKGANSIQNYGGVQTYLRRYLYMNAFDIVEADIFDSQDFEKKKRKKIEKNDFTELLGLCKRVFTKVDNEKKKEVVAIMKKLGYNDFIGVEEKQENSDIIAIANTLEVKVPENLLKEDKQG